jgi:hypothetical protein
LADWLWKLSSPSGQEFDLELAFDSMNKLDLSITSKIQIIKNYPEKMTDSLKIKIGKQVAEYFENNPEIQDWQIQKMLDYIYFARNKEILARSIKFYNQGDWRKRLKHYLKSGDGNFEKIVTLSEGHLTRSVLELAKLEIDALSGSPEALDQLILNGKETRQKSSSIFDMTAVEKLNLCKKSFQEGAVTRIAVKFVLQTNGQYINDLQLNTFQEGPETDLEFRELLVKAYHSRNLYLQVISKLKNIDFNHLSDKERQLLLWASRQAKDFDLFLKIYPSTPIQDSKNLAEISAELANAGRWEESELFFLSA